jgi:hypothetical protein
MTHEMHVHKVQANETHGREMDARETHVSVLVHFWTRVMVMPLVPSLTLSLCQALEEVKAGKIVNVIETFKIFPPFGYTRGFLLFGLTRSIIAFTADDLVVLLVG